MALSKEYKQLFSQLNKALDEWDALGVKPNEVRYAENMLESFYEWSGKNVKNSDRFSTRIKLTEEQQDELEMIAQSIVNMEIFTEEYYDEPFMKAFETVKGKYGIDTIEQYKDYVDAKDRFRNEKLITSIMGWYEYDKLKQRYKKKYGSINEQKLNDIITDVYLSTGKEKDELYEFVYKNM